VERRLSLDRGDVIVFRGDLVHAGAEAPAGHWGRLHVYLDSLEVKHTNKTHFGTCATPVRTRVSKRRLPIAETEEEAR
jgi:hypothetical protein